jgi:hypothetical protein
MRSLRSFVATKEPKRPRRRLALMSVHRFRQVWRSGTRLSPIGDGSNNPRWAEFAQTGSLPWRSNAGSCTEYSHSSDKALYLMPRPHAAPGRWSLRLLLYWRGHAPTRLWHIRSPEKPEVTSPKVRVLGRPLLVTFGGAKVTIMHIDGSSRGEKQGHAAGCFHKSLRRGGNAWLLPLWGLPARAARPPRYRWGLGEPG